MAEQQEINQPIEQQQNAVKLDGEAQVVGQLPTEKREEMRQKGLCVGIDLGTTFSSISIYDEVTKQPILLKDELGNESIPSWVSFSEVDKIKGKVLVGYSAKNSDKTDSVIYDAKRLIGREYKDIFPEDDDEKMSIVTQNKWPFEIVNDNDVVKIETKNPRGEGTMEKFIPEEISGMILKFLINFLEKQRPGEEIENIIVTVPADFKPHQRKATELACELAGINKEKLTLLNEPSAAIIEYKRLFGNVKEEEEKKKEEEPPKVEEPKENDTDKKPRSRRQKAANNTSGPHLKDGSKVVVIDFGGGTLDINCCEIQKDVVKVVKNFGDQNLGGNDFDNVMIEIIKEQLIENGIIEDNYYSTNIKKATPAAKRKFKGRMNRLRLEAERVKILLSTKTNCDLRINDLMGEDYDEDEMEIEVSISRKMFETRCQKEKLYDKFSKCLKTVCTRASFSDRNVDLILLIGGTCKMPKIKELVGKLFNINKIARDEFDPLTAVSKGAAFHAFNGLEAAVAGKKLFETIPYPVGLEVKGGKFFPLCYDGEHLPIKKTHKIASGDENQKQVNFNLYRGFGDYVENNEHVGHFVIDIPQQKERISFIVEMTINDSGLLSIKASTDIKEKPKDDNEDDEKQEEQKVKNVSESKDIKMDLIQQSEEMRALEDHFRDFPVV